MQNKMQGAHKYEVPASFAAARGVSSILLRLRGALQSYANDLKSGGVVSKHHHQEQTQLHLDMACWKQRVTS